MRRRRRTALAIPNARIARRPIRPSTMRLCLDDARAIADDIDAGDEARIVTINLIVTRAARVDDDDVRPATGAATGVGGGIAREWVHRSSSSSRGRLDVVVGGSTSGARVLFVEVGWRGNADDEGNRDDGDVVHGEGTIGTG